LKFNMCGLRLVKGLAMACPALAVKAGARVTRRLNNLLAAVPERQSS